ncbi:acid protease, partial [Thozetella sp. PMI_491]
MRGDFSLLALAAPIREWPAKLFGRDNSPRLVSFALHSDRPPSLLAKRAQDIKLEGNRTTVSYFIKLYFGTPQQPVKLLVTTGGSDTWVRSSCGNLSGDDLRNCTGNGVYNATKSSTSKDLNLTQNITYQDGSSVKMTYVTDSVWFDTGVAVQNIEFGVTNNTIIPSGLLGLGFGESSQETNYLTFLDQLVSQRVINSKAFSLALGNQSDSNNGVVIFGGVDTKKFSGKLTPVSILTPPQNGDSTVRYYVQMNSIALTNPGGQPRTYAGSSAVVVPSLGTTLTYLPNDTVVAVARDLNGARVVSDDLDFYRVSCAQMQNTSYLSFNFGAFSIPVAVSELVFKQGTICWLGIVFSSARPPIYQLGQNVLRSAYVVFDQSQSTVSLAQYIDCGQNEQEMPTSGAAGFVGEC